MNEGLRSWLAVHLPGHETRSFVALGEGEDHTAYELNRELIVRQTKEPDRARRATQIHRETELLSFVARWSTLAVPEPTIVDADAGILVYPKLHGVPLLDHVVVDPQQLSPALAGFLTRLHSAPLAEAGELVEPDPYPLPRYLDDAVFHYRAVVGELPVCARRRIDRFLTIAPPPEPDLLVMAHNDLGAEHLLVEEASGVLTGVIDWSDAALADPARDFARILRDLGPEVLGLTLAGYAGVWSERARERAHFYARCALLEDLDYGFRTGEARYVRGGLRNLDRTFRGVG